MTQVANLHNLDVVIGDLQASGPQQAHRRPSGMLCARGRGALSLSDPPRSRCGVATWQATRSHTPPCCRRLLRGTPTST